MIMHIVGNRPQFIKLAPLYHELNRRGYKQLIIHSGQHYDENMSDIFFRELDIPEPAYNLNVGSGSHAEITSKAMLRIEKTLINNPTELLFVYGDTDTSLAAAIAAKKLNVPIAHVEGGVRSGNRSNPEENNRIIVDHMSDIIFCPDRDSVLNATSENLGDRSFCTGDIMYDTYIEMSQKLGECGADGIILMTWHRQENTSSKERMNAILDLLGNIEDVIICPMHPRTVKCLKQFELWEKANKITNLQIIEPVGYSEMVRLMSKSKLILTDSGGLSKESSFAGIKCLFMVDLDIWPDLLRSGWIIKINPEDNKDVERAIQTAKYAIRYPEIERPRFYGDGHSARIMIDMLIEKKLLK